MLRLIFAGLVATTAVGFAQSQGLPKGVRLIPGAVNGVEISGNVLVYGDPSGKLPEKHAAVLLTTGRRDAAWAAYAASAKGTPVVAPEEERKALEDPAAFWAGFESARFHDYAQASTKMPRAPLAVSRGVKPGEEIAYGGVRFRVLNARGYSPGAVAYFAEIERVKIAFTGDLIYGDGKVLDLYSMQDAIPETRTRGYHGFAARAGDLIENLRAIAALKPDVLVPLRGPVIRDPQAAIQRLIERLQQVMASHFSTDALLWYWGPESLKSRSAKALDGQTVNSMPMAPQRKLPEWVVAAGNSRIVISESGAALLIDGGYSKIGEELDRLKREGRIRQLDAIWVTHYHDDHTDYVDQLAKKHAVPVWASAEIRDILEHPGRFRMPASTHASIEKIDSRHSGERWEWREFGLESLYFPGQTLYHGGLLLRKRGAEQILFVGDSFTPSGIDDYCLQNRNFVERGQGYQYCLDEIGRLEREHPEDPLWLVNQHVAPMFRFERGHTEFMRRELDARAAAIADLGVLPGANFAVDESWARVYPYHSVAAVQRVTGLELVLKNHSKSTQTFEIQWNLPAGVELVTAERYLTLAPGAEGRAAARVRAKGKGLHVLTADIAFGGMHLREWAEGMLRIEQPLTGSGKVSWC